MSKDIINFDAVRLTTELNKFQRHKAIPNSFFDGTFTIPQVLELYESLSKRHKRIADKLIKQYKVDLNASEEGLVKSLRSEYTAFLENQHTRNDKWWYPAVMNKYRYNINPVRAITYEVREMAYSYNSHNEHHHWLTELITEPNFYHRVIQDNIKDRNKVDKILNYYHPLIVEAGINEPIEMRHLRVLRTDLLEYANLFTTFRNWTPDE